MVGEKPTSSGFITMARIPSASAVDVVTPADEPHKSKSKVKKVPKSQISCRFFGKTGGCRAGNNCPFLHGNETSNLSNAVDSVKQEKTSAEPPPAKSEPSRNARRQFQPRQVDPSKVVAKPQPTVSKRDHEIQQVKRRFSPLETATIDTTILSFKLQPTDPDFPYELEALECVLQVPKTYPKDEPHLNIQNKEMEKGFRINIEKGFLSIVRGSTTGTLLSWLNSLDRQLEVLLSGKKAETIKFVSNRQSNISTEPQLTTSLPVIEKPAPIVTPRKVEPRYSQAQRDTAMMKREMDTRQLEARLGRQAMYAKSSDGIAYTLPIEPRRKADLPSVLQNVKSVRLFVPMLYPLLPCRIALQGVPRDAAQVVEQAFEQRVKENTDISLVGHINCLVTHMHGMAEPLKNEVIFEPDEIGIDELALSADEQHEPDLVELQRRGVDDRSHIQFIPRPPEWNLAVRHNGEGEEEDDDSEDHSEDLTSEDETVVASTTAPERGVSIDLPHLELHGIELLDLIALSLSIRCLRCKETTDVDNLRHTDAGQKSTRLLACKKCASEISIAFHHQFVHPNSVRAGYLDLDNCTVADMLLSKFAPTCSNCTTTQTDPAMTAVRGDTSLTICRKCHTKMSFKMPEVKFLLVSSSNKLPPLKKAKKPRENLGIRAGEPLPRHGRCSHYAKSYRWFRFGCCAKVYACDRCHDEKEAHPNEHANRMICGYCSREQRYRPEDCSICKAILVGKKYTGFWEGGQGTRDKTRMSRKDPRKYKRRGGNSAVGGS